ncbi:MAG: ribosome biogenesis GTPase Der [Spirochaetes bacterium]|nr:MAG: ribosome biogenesis GTPase Der [Spirochaetota bacterium]
MVRSVRNNGGLMAKNLPVVTIVGRQNVGKSTLFNALIQQKKAIVDPMPGLTRDILSCAVTHDEAAFMLCDTPGLDIRDPSQLSQTILENTKAFLGTSSVIILLFENPAPSSFDYELSDIVRKLSLPTIVAVNKMDSAEEYENLSNFYEMGFSEVLPLAAQSRTNMGLLLDAIVRELPVRRQAAAESDMRIAIVGRPNCGKSTLLNSLTGFTRSVVSDVPGTTRDSVDEELTFQGRRLTVIDTAGIRRKSKITENVDFYSVTRTRDSIRRADVVVHLIDAQAGLTETDKKISDEILTAHKPLIIAINKWDAIEKDTKTFQAFKEKLVFQFYRAGDFPIISISAKEKQRIHKLLELAMDLNDRANTRIDTPRLNKIMEGIQRSRRLPLLGDTLKIYYITQTESRPPKFKLFVNRPELFRKDVVRFLEKELQNQLGATGIPMVLIIEGKKRDNARRGR